MANRTDRVVIVTGAAQGLGRAMALALAAAGSKVACVDLAQCQDDMEQMRALATERGISPGRLLSIVGDVTNPSDCAFAVETTIKHFGDIHGLINNAALGMQYIGPVLAAGRKRFFEVSTDRWKDVIDVNINGPFNMAHATTPQLVKRGFGRIVNVVTSYPTMVDAGFSPYGPSKAALEAATVIWAKDLAGTGVTVNALLPGGPADTRQIPSSDGIDRSRLLKPEVMAAPSVWLMTEAGHEVTGRRFIAALWDKDLPFDEAAKNAGAPAGWQQL
jgi:NAD(P)-dependent dehydrogenase (short-subunit alcohol dehydrogenase family)